MTPTNQPTNPPTPHEPSSDVIVRDLDAWLAHAERLHPRSIDLTLDRISAMLARLELGAPPFQVITVGGTNGKGSCVAFLEAILLAAGHRVGVYSSPHLVHYTERVRLDGREIAATALAESFARVEAVRGDLALTYFEFGTAAALDAFRAAGVGIAVLEVGLGGRLDAVNAVEPLASIVTSIALDHQELLGADREAIGREKAGIFRAGRPAICGDDDPPASLIARADEVGARLERIDVEFRFEVGAEQWTLTLTDRALRDLPLPALEGAFQLRNAACAIAALVALEDRLAVPEQAIRAGLRAARNPGRLERIALDDGVELVLDVAHNPHAAAALARALMPAAPSGANAIRGRTHAVIGVLVDKDAVGIASALDGVVDHWYAAGLDGARGRSGTALAAALQGAVRAPLSAHPDVIAALSAARGAARRGDRILVLGSFQTVGAVLAAGIYSR